MEKKGRVLVVDDNKDLLKSIEKILKFDFEEIITLNKPLQISSVLKEKDIDIILLDMNFTEGDNSGQDGLYWLKKILSIDPASVVIMITAYGDIDLAVDTIKAGATDFITKPWEPAKLIATLQSALSLRKAKVEVKKLKHKNKKVEEDFRSQFDPIIGNSKPVMEMLNLINKIAKTDANVLILGENGTGKELIAREIHNRSKRNSESFLNVDLTTLSESIFESELFGHVKGAFTDAKEDKPGRFQLATNGSLFLDEIGNLSIALQAKLLGALQQRVVMPVGGSKQIPFDIRLICATNKDLSQMVKDQLFREDLLYRINTITITAPPLRERGEDILLIADYFIQKFSNQYQKTSPKLNAKACDKLLNYKWPGNIRELKHSVEKAVILNEDGILRAEDFFYNPSEATEKQELFTLELDTLEKTAIEKALKQAGGNISKASSLLGISRTSLYSKMKKYDL